MTALAYRPENALNAICPYFTMFPLEYPLRVLRRHLAARPTVVDPFCGRGTTLFAARKLGLTAWGVDTSSVAIAIAQAKLANCDVEDAITLCERLLNEFAGTSVPAIEFFAEAFHADTLRDISALREGLLRLSRQSNAAILLRAAALGCLHGPVAKNFAEQSHFSNQMQRTFAPKPAYALKYWKRHRLRAPRIDVVTIIRRKLERIIASCSNGKNRYCQVIHGDSQRRSIFSRIDPQYSVVITSPPYYGMRTYVQDQWLRHWFLGGPASVDYAKQEQLPQASQDIFAGALGQVWKNLALSTPKRLHMYIRFGAIPCAKVNARSILLESLEGSAVKWKVVSIRNAGTASRGKRQATQMCGDSTAMTELDFHVVRR